ncbi:MAG: nicotinate-nucleotide adenylyltransferase [Candidatus Aminicenantales bacterium]
MGLFGGTFDPVHCGHLQAAHEVRTAFSLDKVLLIPSFTPPHKERAGMAPAADRLRMVELACAGEPGFEASSIEVDAGEKSYSIITLEKIRRIYPLSRVFFILGIDAFLEIDTWRDHERVLEECHFIVMTRPGFRFEDAGRVLGGALRGRIHRVSGAETIDESLFESPRIFFTPIRAMDVSSTEVRRRIRSGESVRGLVPDPVDEFIRARHLYREASK